MSNGVLGGPVLHYSILLIEVGLGDSKSLLHTAKSVFTDYIVDEIDFALCCREFYSPGRSWSL